MAGSSRMMIMIPLMLVMGKIDFENLNILYAARAVFIAMQLGQLALAYWLKQKVQASQDNTKIFVPATKPSPFNPAPAGSEPMKATTYGEYEVTKAAEFLQQSGVGALISSFIHFKFGVNQVVVLQSVTVPLNVYEQPLVQKYLFGKGKDSRVYGEKFPGEEMVLASEDGTTSTTPAAVKQIEFPSNAKDAIVYTWDAAAQADFSKLYQVVKGSPNAATKEDGWTALMVACGSPVAASDFITKILKANADPTKIDNDGWTALHWAAFHGRADSAKTLLGNISSSKLVQQLKDIKAKDGRTAFDVATEEDNTAVVKILKSEEDQVDSKSDDTLRQRKKDSDMLNVD